ncbi:MAG TPA: hypothetical protein VIT45_05845 [Allosphingosinicella sp.]
MASNPILANKSNAKHGKNGFYDLRLVRSGDNGLTVEVVLSIFLDFVPNDRDPSVTWGAGEGAAFIDEWKRQIAGKWDRSSYVTYREQDISLRFVLDIRDKAKDTQWQMRVFKMGDDSIFRPSAVGRSAFKGKYDAEFDSNDDVLKPGTDQTALIHEFGHMIGNEDEYVERSEFSADTLSIMHHGGTVRDRHLDHFVSWAKPQVDSLIENKAKPKKKKKGPGAMLHAVISDGAAGLELAAIKGWRDNRDHGDGAQFTVRRRDTGDRVPIAEVRIEDFAMLELVFADPDGGPGGAGVWQPRSAEALKAVFVE